MRFVSTVHLTVPSIKAVKATPLSTFMQHEVPRLLEPRLLKALDDYARQHPSRVSQPSCFWCRAVLSSCLLLSLFLSASLRPAFCLSCLCVCFCAWCVCPAFAPLLRRDRPPNCTNSRPPQFCGYAAACL